MTKKIFRNIIFCVLVSILIVISLFFNALYQEFLNETENNLKEELLIVERGVKLEGEDFLNNLNITQRVSIIGEDGTVLYDNHTDETTLENHLDREEVIEALEYGSGSARRYSSSVLEQAIYVSSLLDNGNILRLSTNLDSAQTLLLKMITHILWILILVMIITFIIASRLSKKIVEPINNIDLDNIDVVAPYKELNPLYTKLDRQNYTISKQIQELKKRSDEFRLIIANMSEGIIIINKEKEILTYNDATLTLFKKNKIEANSSIYQLYRSQTFMSAIEEVLKGNRQDIRIDFDDKYYDVIMGPVSEEDSISGATIIVFDITQKVTQEFMRQEFSANVSHELKTPLTTISGFAEIMKNGLVDPSDYKDISTNIYDEAQRLISLVEDIIHLSSLESSSIEEKETINIKALVMSIFNHFRGSANKKGTSLIYEGDENITYDGVYSIMEEMISNLVDNAIKYGKEDGFVKVIVSKDKDLVIKVIDDGIGIEAKEKERIFERFYRIDKSRSKKLGGTGLGLSIVKHAAIYHEGRIDVESDDNGSSFIITLPIKD